MDFWYPIPEGLEGAWLNTSRCSTTSRSYACPVWRGSTAAAGNGTSARTMTPPRWVADRENPAQELWMRGRCWLKMLGAFLFYFIFFMDCVLKSSACGWYKRWARVVGLGAQWGWVVWVWLNLSLFSLLVLGGVLFSPYSSIICVFAPSLAKYTEPALLCTRGNTFVGRWRQREVRTSWGWTEELLEVTVPSPAQMQLIFPLAEGIQAAGARLVCPWSFGAGRWVPRTCCGCSEEDEKNAVRASKLSCVQQLLPKRWNYCFSVLVLSFVCVCLLLKEGEKKSQSKT